MNKAKSDDGYPCILSHDKDPRDAKLRQKELLPFRKAWIKDVVLNKGVVATMDGAYKQLCGEVKRDKGPCWDRII